MKLMLSSLLLFVAAGCATPDTSPKWSQPGWKPDGRLQIAIINPGRQPANADVRLYQPGELLPDPHTVLAFISANGDAGEEARIVTMMLDYARSIGATGVVLLGPERPNQGLAVGQPVWQPSGRRVFRANIITTHTTKLP